MKTFNRDSDKDINYRDVYANISRGNNEKIYRDNDKTLIEILTNKINRDSYENINRDNKQRNYTRDGNENINRDMRE